MSDEPGGDKRGLPMAKCSDEDKRYKFKVTNAKDSRGVRGGGVMVGASPVSPQGVFYTSSSNVLGQLCANRVGHAWLTDYPMR